MGARLGDGLGDGVEHVLPIRKRAAVAAARRRIEPLAILSSVFVGLLGRSLGER
jgi:hypothetical protein